MADARTGQNPVGTWDEDPDGASILLATGRPRHDVLVIAEPALLADLDRDWGRPAARVRLSFLPGVSAPGAPGQEDALLSYEHDGLGVLVARGRTSLFEGKPARRTTALARIAAGAGVRTALLVTRAMSLGTARPGDFLPVADHLNLTGAPLFPATTLLEASWDEDLAARLARLDGVREPGVVALASGPLRPTRAEAGLLGGLGADASVTDSVAEAMAMACRGVRVAGLAYVDSAAAASPRRSGRRAADGAVPLRQRPATAVVASAVEVVLAAAAGRA